MKNKILTTILLFIVLLLCSASCFANNDTNLGNEVQDSAQKSQTTLQSAGEGIKNIASDIGNGVQDAAQDVGRGVEDMFDGNDNMRASTGNYTATRTSTDGMTGGAMTNTAWVWLILGIVGVVIVALTWYYVSQSNDSSKRH